jgi:hypothetical protein
VPPVVKDDITALTLFLRDTHLLQGFMQPIVQELVAHRLVLFVAIEDEAIVPRVLGDKVEETFPDFWKYWHWSLLSVLRALEVIKMTIGMPDKQSVQ